MVASGRQPASLVLPVPAELGRRIAAAGKTHEIDDERMSRDHALVTTERGLWLISDRDSRNGTFVDGERVHGEVRRRGDVVLRLGHTVFVLLGDGRGHGAGSGGIDAVGHFQMAHGGTLFLDEVADLDAAVQAKLLRVIETREVVPVGATTGTPVDIGIVAASHRELRQAVAERRFRDDLYYRLALTTAHLPPLRARKVDLARLVRSEVAAVSRTLAAHPRLVEACCLRPWPGNVRELRSAVSQAAGDALAAGRDTVRLDDLAATAGLPVVAGEPERPKQSAGEVDKDAGGAALG